MNTHIHYRSATRLEFCVDAMLHGGYHEYQDIWTATSGERLKCACKIGNRSDFYLLTSAFTLSFTARIIDGLRSLWIRYVAGFLQILENELLWTGHR